MARRYYLDVSNEIRAVFNNIADAEDDLLYSFCTREVVGNAKLRKGFLVVATSPTSPKKWPSGFYAHFNEAQLHMWKLKQLLVSGEAWIYADFELGKLHSKEDLVKVGHYKW